jgi:hypothetical protein
MRLIPVLLTATALLPFPASAAEQRVRSPDGKLTLIVSDTGLRLRDVLMVGHTAADFVTNDLVVTLAAPSHVTASQALPALQRSFFLMFCEVHSIPF